MVRINLLPVKQAKKRGAGQQQLVLFALVLAALGIALFFAYNQEGEAIAKLTEQKVKIKTEMDRLEEIIGNIEDFQTKKKDLKKKLDIISMLKGNRTGPVRILDEISTIIPKKVWLTTLAQNGKNLKMDGMATDNKEIAVYMKNLEASPFFDGVTLLTIEQAKGGSQALPIMKFTVTCRFKLPK